MMSIFQPVHLSFANGWWFTVIFLSINAGMIAYYPKHFKSRVLKQPDFDNKLQKVTSLISFILFQFVIWYSALLPLRFDTVSCYIGIPVFMLGLAGYIRAMYDYATTPPGQPVTKCIYRISRNPQQIMSAMLWIGAGLLLGEYVIIICCILQLILSYPGFLAQEQTCIKKYGQAYIDYMNKTGRYISLQ
jgi:protein-S-isoprenylcysteine O-methyltransferase Ste14